MADFKIAMQKLRDLEGGYVNNPLNHGGETYAGISRAANPLWPGWVFVDRLKVDYPNVVELSQALDNNPLVQQLVENFYQQTFWKFDDLPQEIAEKVFQIEVNFGRTRGVQILQQALGESGHPVEIDGSLGPQTIGETIAAASRYHERLLAALRAFAALRHCEIVIANPDQQRFLKGWLLRDAQ